MLLLYFIAALRLCASEEDVVTPRRVGVSVQHYGDTDRPKRSSSATKYAPIRIRTFYYELDAELTANEQARLKKAVDDATARISELLSVIPVDGRILLSRTDACGGQWVSGEAAGKCALLVSNYQGETVQDNFKLPDDHLAGLELCPQPTLASCTSTQYMDGSGVTDVDLVIYLRALTTNRCSTNPSLVAYAGHFELDQNSRPIAGYANFCPKYTKDTHYEEAVLKMVAIHEFFHILAYNEVLFKEFRNCSGLESSCSLYATTTVKKDGAFHLVTPKLSKRVRGHFNCTDAIGAPLENFGATSTGSSHLEMRVFRGSVMTAAINRAHLTFVDGLTMAVFEDSGWYQVNYKAADFNPWGLNQGCDFGRTSKCQTEPSDFFCSPGSPQGCHFLMRDKAVCTTTAYLDSCYVQEAASNGNCEANTDLNFGQSHGANSRCFQGTIISGLTVFQSGFCLAINCSGSSTVHVKVGSRQYQQCPSRSTVNFPDEWISQVSCPPDPAVLCPSKIQPTSVSSNYKIHTVVSERTEQVMSHLTTTHATLTGGETIIASHTQHSTAGFIDTRLLTPFKSTSISATRASGTVRSRTVQLGIFSQRPFTSVMVSSSSLQNTIPVSLISSSLQTTPTTPKSNSSPALSSLQLQNTPSSLQNTSTLKSSSSLSSLRTAEPSMASSVSNASAWKSRSSLEDRHTLSTHDFSVQNVSSPAIMSSVLTNIPTQTQFRVNPTPTASSTSHTNTNQAATVVIYRVILIFPLNYDDIGNDLDSFIKAFINYVATVLSINGERIRNVEVSAGSIIVSFSVVSQSQVNSTAVSSEENCKTIGSSVLEERFTFQFNSMNFTTTNVSCIAETSTTTSSQQEAIASAVVASVTTAIAICGLLCYLKKKNTDKMKVSPHERYLKPKTPATGLRRVISVRELP